MSFSAASEETSIEKDHSTETEHHLGLVSLKNATMPQIATDACPMEIIPGSSNGCVNSLNSDYAERKKSFSIPDYIQDEFLEMQTDGTYLDTNIASAFESFVVERSTSSVLLPQNSLQVNSVPAATMGTGQVVVDLRIDQRSKQTLPLYHNMNSDSVVEPELINCINDNSILSSSPDSSFQEAFSYLLDPDYAPNDSIESWADLPSCPTAYTIIVSRRRRQLS
ncbi:hypothetical protein GJ496_003497 [Pomphorhynchus laevis]|nr:hypothetical protein GJ496_010531 [Pomphorhynchus laevis]KAI0981929.1 hypothetical protein GJ496_009767 [Pomphorhynchus laevis]KAI0982413.1 hypothetical protein GJ496_003497 [Pomphorhynchus laevis]